MILMTYCFIVWLQMASKNRHQRTDSVSVLGRDRRGDLDLDSSIAQRPLKDQKGHTRCSIPVQGVQNGPGPGLRLGLVLPVTPPASSPAPRGGHQGSSVCQQQGKQGSIDELTLNAAHLDAAQQQAQCPRPPRPPSPRPLYEIKRTFITVPASPFTPKSPPQGSILHVFAENKLGGCVCVQWTPVKPVSVSRSHRATEHAQYLFTNTHTRILINTFTHLIIRPSNNWHY